MVWTAEAIEDLKRLAREGKSASAIAAALGVASRNAVIGKANRIGIRLGGGGRATSPSGPLDWPARAQAAADSNPGSRADKRTATWAVAEAAVGEMRRLRFEDIREFACRWPLGDPRSGDLLYCGLGRAEGRSYCAAHCRMAYRPPKSASPRERPRAVANSWRPR